jgi:predicted homoserine dehydrogenase-like protein
VTFRASSEFVRRCFAEYGLRTDTSGWYSAIYKPYHLIGLELGISIASIMVRGESTGKTRGFRGGVTAVAKRDLAEDEVLDGEGGYAVYGRLVPAGAPVARPLRSPDRRQPRRAAEKARGGGEARAVGRLRA